MNLRPRYGIVTALIVAGLFSWYAWASYNPPASAWRIALYPRTAPHELMLGNNERIEKVFNEGGARMAGTGGKPGVGLMANLFDATISIDTRLRGDVVEFRTPDGWSEIPDGANVSLVFGRGALVTKVYKSPRIDRSKPWLDDPEAPTK